MVIMRIKTMSYYRQQKSSKVEQQTKSPITIMWPHSEPYRIINRDVERVAIVDPGVRNFCIRCEDRNNRGKNDSIVIRQMGFTGGGFFGRKTSTSPRQSCQENLTVTRTYWNMSM